MMNKIKNIMKINKEIYNNIIAIFGILLYAIGINIFITPLGLYAGGIYGYCQLIRTFIENMFSINFGTIDTAGFIYTIVNIPLLIYSIKILNKKFFIKTIIGIIFSNIFLSFININNSIVNDVLTSCIIGGILSGIGIGITLSAGSSMGGTDIIGMCLIKKKTHITMGKIFVVIDLVLYIICAILFDLEIAIYSMIFSFIVSMATDKLHMQNIKVNALIFTNNYDIAKQINNKLVRGSTSWEGKGDFSGQKKYIISTVISKYEEIELKNIVHNLDPKAFVIINSNIDVDGNIEKRLES